MLVIKMQYTHTLCSGLLTVVLENADCSPRQPGTQYEGSVVQLVTQDQTALERQRRGNSSIKDSVRKQPEGSLRVCLQLLLVCLRPTVRVRTLGARTTSPPARGCTGVSGSY